MYCFLEWLDEWYLGIHEIDRQHLALATLLNRVAEKLHQTANANPGVEVILPLAHRLLDETRQHFNDEERIMREHDYPGRSDHHREHVMLLAELQAFIREIEENRRPFDLDSLTALKHWLIDHVLDGDMAFARYLGEC